MYGQQTSPKMRGIKLVTPLYRKKTVVGDTDKIYLLLTKEE